MKWKFDYHPISVVPQCTGGQFTLKEDDDVEYPFAVIPCPSIEQKDKQLKRAMIAAASPEMLETLIAVKKDLETVPLTDPIVAALARINDTIVEFENIVLC